jgi:hypothetical protein
LLDIPQPLNRVISNGEFRPNETALNDNPELAKLVASIFALWAGIEHSLSLLLTSVLGADAGPAIAMFATLRGQRLQLGALKAAAKATLSPNDFDVLCAAISMADSVQTPRNHLAHWIWGTCEQLPDALLLAEPKAQEDRERELNLAFERAGGPDVREIINLARYNPATVVVYRRDDLERAKGDLADAERITALLTIYLDRQIRGWASDTRLEGQRVAALREVVFQHFYDKRLFREALDRIRAEQNSAAARRSSVIRRRRATARTVKTAFSGAMTTSSDVLSKRNRPSNSKMTSVCSPTTSE